MPVLEIETIRGVQLMTMNRPKSLNSLNEELSSALIRAFHMASEDDEVRVVVLNGAGKGFCSGLDLTTVDSIGEQSSRFQALDEYGWVGRLALAISECDKPVIAAMNGIAAGAGLSLALAADMRYMAASARVTTGYIRRALSPDAGMSYFLPRLVGPNRAAKWLFTGQDIAAFEAEQAGLVDEVYADGEFMPHVLRIAYDIADQAPLALTYTKRLLHASFDTDLRSQLRQEFTSIKACFATEDVAEGMQAFSEKRKPIYRGR
ncbi:MAG: enoyl-CoA hydratase-related protein [Alicyclobacillaceae bacterium]|uniref:enoyl-CoA hydratase/isomerase family protein n=1 Tax=Alicyclobacillus sp. SP_1 TaxID=2942475 RepID=UPI00215780BA|nr:enoyl-CoA hydratase-related protein [Alicyclobacillus sp. SP_1]MCY0887551.1 enoyl-CoA hydratase-related protein [Alicyclobacillaceae bacterium]MCY0895088.1 enoyl-CoA hydratase-related protein [Alicyclobacillaceae bacterium]